MTIVYKSKSKKNYLYLVGEGVEDGLEENKKFHQMIVNLCREHNCHRVLIDDQKVIYAASIISIYQLAEYYAKADTLHYIKGAAVVANPDFKESNVFFENTTRNRGINLRLFYNVDDAEVLFLKE